MCRGRFAAPRIHDPPPPAVARAGDAVYAVPHPPSAGAVRRARAMPGVCCEEPHGAPSRPGGGDRARRPIMSNHERRSEPAPPHAPTTPAPIIGPCVGCGTPCDVREYLACAECLADRDKTLVAAGRLETLRWWFERYARLYGGTS